MMRESPSLKATMQPPSSARRGGSDTLVASVSAQPKAVNSVHSHGHPWFIFLRLIGVALRWGALILVVASAISGLNLRFALDALGGFLLADSITLMCWHQHTLRSFKPVGHHLSSVLSWCGSVGCLGVVCVASPSLWMLHASGVAVIGGGIVWLCLRVLTRIRSGRGAFGAVRSM